MTRQEKKTGQMQHKHSRRHFLQMTAAEVTLITGTGLAKERRSVGTKSHQDVREKKLAFELGLASYTLRKFDLEQMLAMTKRVGLNNIALKSYHLPLESSAEQIGEITQKVRSAGLNLYGGGVVYMKSEAEVNRAFEYAKAAGMQTIIGVPNPELLPLVNEKVEQYNIKVAIHNHGPGDKRYPTPDSVYEKVINLDKRIGICNDIGHTIRAGIDPAESVKKFADRLLDVHVKDVTEATAKGRNVEVGRGVIDIPALLETLIEIGYSGVAAFEYEKDEDDPLPGLAESVGYVRGVLTML